MDQTVGKDELNIGEIWTDLAWSDAHLEYNQDASRQQLCDWINGTDKRSCAFDFAGKGILQEAVKNMQFDPLKDSQGKAPSLLEWWPGKTVTFVDNHDTGSTQNHWPFPAESVPLGYAYILTHPGIPTLFWEHVFDWGDDVKKAITDLAALRARNGLHSESKLDIVRNQVADADCYLAVVDDKVAVKLGPRCELGDLKPSKAEGWALSLSGKDWAVWERVTAA